MNILLINDLLEVSGGAEVSFKKTAKLLKKNGHNVFLLGRRGNKEDIITFFSRWISPYFFLKTLIEIKKNKIDIVHVNNFTRAVSPSPLLAAKLLNTPSIVTIRDFFLYCPKTWAIFSDGKKCLKSYNFFCPFYRCESMRMGLRNIPYNLIKLAKGTLHRLIIKKSANLFVCISEDLKIAITRSFKLPEEKVVFIPNFIEMNADDNKKTNKDRKGLLFVGRISKEKGLEVAVKAIAILVNKKKINDVSLKIVGDGPDLEKIKTLVNKLNIAKYVNFLGKVKPDQVDDFYLKSKAVIFPSLWQEAFGRVIIEAMKQKTPVISSNIGGASKFIIHKRNGLIFERGNEKELAESIEYVLKNQDRAKKMGEEGYKTVKKLFNEETHYKKLIKTYKQLLSFNMS